MTEYYGSGIFCSRKCANARNHSKETKDNIANGIIYSKKVRHLYRNEDGSLKHKYCKICNKEINLAIV